MSPGMIPRLLACELLAQLGEFPIVTILGPRQAGKTTLARMTLPGFDYVSLEDPDTRAIAEGDPRALLKRHPTRTIFDEVQRVPSLLSYLQGVVDQTGRSGQFVLTGSHQLSLHEAISQSLAGRTGILHLLPLSIAELTTASMTLAGFEHYALHGFLPRVHAHRQRPYAAYASYYQTYVERDVRQLVELKDASVFAKFMKLLAGRVGQLVNHSSLAADTGVSAKTVGSWLSILEASFVVFKLPPYFENFGKRVIKSPKYFFTEPGLVTYLLGIETPDQVLRDPLVGSIFENLVVIEALKACYNQGRPGNLYFFRDSHGREIDLVHPRGRALTGVEIKSSSTFHAGFHKELLRFSEKVTPLARSYLVYSGMPLSLSNGVRVLPLERTSEIFARE